MISVKANSVSDTANAANSDAKEPGKKMLCCCCWTVRVTDWSLLFRIINLKIIESKI